MADIERGNRPLSPHLTIYRPQITSMSSILTRITGIGLLAGMLLVVAWLFSTAISQECFEAVDGFVHSWLGQLILIGSLWALSYHALAGIRHMIWDQGWCLELETAQKLGWAVLIGSFVATAIVVIAI